MYGEIYNEDCVIGLKSISDNFVDLTVTSPPYDNLRTYNGYAKSFQFEPTARELYRVIKPGGVLVWVVNDATIKGSETGTSFKQALFFKEIGFNLHDTMIFQKHGMAYPDVNRYYSNFEYMFVLSKGKPKTVNLLCDRKNKHSGKKPGSTNRLKNGKLVQSNCVKANRRVKEYGVRFNVWQYHVGFEGDNLVHKHPATFPLNLAEDHIKSWSDECDMVLDPFLGSGTTAIAALKLNRNFIGFEINEIYFDLAKERIENVLTSFDN